MPEDTPATKEAGASMIEYLMLMAFVAMISIVGLQVVGPAAAALFDIERLGLTTSATAPAQVLGITVERHTRFDSPVPTAWASPVQAAHIGVS